jgi:hypothetical protein
MLLCSLASPLRCARIHLEAPDKKGQKSDCQKDVAARTMDLIERLTAYFQDCEMTDTMFSMDEENKVTITDEGTDKLCKATCKSHVDLVKAAPDNTALIEACPRDRNIFQVILHDALDAARLACPSEEVPLVDIEDNSASTNEVVVPEAVEDDIVEVSPKAPMKGNRIKQLTFEYELKAALAARNAGTCSNLIKMFKKCDYKNVGKVWISQVDAMLDKLDSEKQESLLLLNEIMAKAEKDPETKPMTFKDWTVFKFGLSDATDCALEYAKQKK